MAENTFYYEGHSPVFQLRPGETAQQDLKLSLCRTELPKPFCYRVRIVCAETQEGIPGVSVRIKNGIYSESGRTGNTGEAVFRIPSSWRQIEIQMRKPGFCSRYIGTHFICEEKDTFCLSAD